MYNMVIAEHTYLLNMLGYYFFISKQTDKKCVTYIYYNPFLKSLKEEDVTLSASFTTAHLIRIYHIWSPSFKLTVTFIPQPILSGNQRPRSVLIYDIYCIT